VAVDQTLAQASNLLVYSSMAVYAGALIAFATDLSVLGRAAGRAEDERAAQPRRVAVAAGPASTEVNAAPPVAGATAEAEPGAARVRRPAAGIGVSLTWLAFALHLGAVVARGLSAQRVPWSNMYEFSVAGAVVVTGVFLVLLLQRDLRYLGTFVVGPVLLMLGLSVTVLYTESAQLVPALQSYWLVIHVSVAFVASALLTISFSATVLQLVQQRREQLRADGREVRGGRFMDGLPRSAELDRASYRMIAVAFPLWTFTLVAGSIWAEKAWGRYWGWDPKEVWTFVIWTVYAAYLHARSTRGWDGRRSAYLAIAGFVCLLINFGVVNIFFTGNHSYAGIG
jgi:cytochrome c-type biogenesis protein CcsB